MTALPRLPFAVLPLLIAVAATALAGRTAYAQPGEASAAQQQRQSQREHIQRQRQEVDAQRGRQEAACYQAFAVHDCLREVRSQARAQDNALRAQEIELNDADRRERATQRRQAIADKQGEQAHKLGAGERPAPVQSSARKDASANAAPAQQRAQQQRAQQAAHAAELARRQQGAPQRAAEARAQYEAKQQRARERRAQHEREQAERATSGQAAPAPLPVAPGSAAKP